MAEYPDLDDTVADQARRFEWYAPDRPVNGTAFIRGDDERPDLDGRDPATLTDLEKLAYAYPEVAELVRERDELAKTLERAKTLSGAKSAEITKLRAACTELEAQRDALRAEPNASQLRGAVDWLLYFYALPRSAWSDEEDQTAAAQRLLGDDLAAKVIAAAEASAELEWLRAIEQAARRAMFERPSAPARDELRALLERAQ